MDESEIIIGAGVVGFGVIAVRDILTGEISYKRYVGLLVATTLISGLSIAGLGKIANPLAMALLMAIITMNGKLILDKTSNIMEL